MKRSPFGAALPLTAQEQERIDKRTLAYTDVYTRLTSLQHDEKFRIFSPEKIRQEFTELYSSAYELITEYEGLAVLYGAPPTNGLNILASARTILEATPDAPSIDPRKVGLAPSPKPREDYSHLDLVTLLRIPNTADYLPLHRFLNHNILTLEDVHEQRDIELPTTPSLIAIYVEFRRTLESAIVSRRAATQPDAKRDEQLKKLEATLNDFKHTIQSQVMSHVAQGDMDTYELWEAIPEFQDWIQALDSPDRASCYEYATEATVTDIRSRVRRELAERELFTTSQATAFPSLDKRDADNRAHHGHGHTSSHHHKDFTISLAGHRTEAVARLREDLTTEVLDRSELSPFFTLLEHILEPHMDRLHRYLSSDDPEAEAKETIAAIRSDMEKFLRADSLLPMIEEAVAKRETEQMDPNKHLPDIARSEVMKLERGKMPKDIRKAVEKFVKVLSEPRPTDELRRAIYSFYDTHVFDADRTVSRPIADRIDYILAREKTTHDGAEALHDILSTDPLSSPSHPPSGLIAHSFSESTIDAAQHQPRQRYKIILLRQ
jgi:hypothetical protein